MADEVRRMRWKHFSLRGDTSTNDLYNSRLKSNAQALRKNMTREERRLWYDFLRELPMPVKRQKVLGPYIVDFYVPSSRLIIELDGSQHYAADGKATDAERDAYLREQGMQVLRYSNADVNQRFVAVCEDILKYIGND